MMEVFQPSPTQGPVYVFFSNYSYVNTRYQANSKGAKRKICSKNCDGQYIGVQLR